MKTEMLTPEHEKVMAEYPGLNQRQWWLVSDLTDRLSSLQAKHDRHEEALKRIRMMTGQGSPYNRIATEALADEVTDER